MRKPKKEIHLTSYEELLGIEVNQENSVDKITEIPIDCLYDFKNHPFHVINDEKMQEQVKNVPTESCIHICGKVVERSSKNPKMSEQYKVVDMKSYRDIVENMHVNWQERLKYQRL